MWGVSEFCPVIKANFAESLQALINISFSKIVGKRGGGERNIKKVFNRCHSTILFSLPIPIHVLPTEFQYFVDYLMTGDYLLY